MLYRAGIKVGSSDNWIEFNMIPFALISLSGSNRASILKKTPYTDIIMLQRTNRLVL